MLFCFNATIAVFPDCDKNDRSNTNLGANYERPDELDPKSKEAKHFLNDGDYQFKVKELEVYSCTF